MFMSSEGVKHGEQPAASPLPYWGFWLQTAITEPGVTHLMKLRLDRAGGFNWSRPGPEPILPAVGAVVVGRRFYPSPFETRLPEITGQAELFLSQTGTRDDVSRFCLQLIDAGASALYYWDGQSTYRVQYTSTGIRFSALGAGLKAALYYDVAR